MPGVRIPVGLAAGALDQFADDVLVELAKDFVDPGFAAHDKRFAGNDLCACDRIGINQRSRKVTGPDVFGKCCRDAGADGSKRCFVQYFLT